MTSKTIYKTAIRPFSGTCHTVTSYSAPCCHKQPGLFSVAKTDRFLQSGEAAIQRGTSVLRAPGSAGENHKPGNRSLRKRSNRDSLKNPLTMDFTALSLVGNTKYLQGFLGRHSAVRPPRPTPVPAPNRPVSKRMDSPATSDSAPEVGLSTPPACALTLSPNPRGLFAPGRP